MDAICDEFEEAWIAGQRRQIEEYLSAALQEPERSALFRELLRVELECRIRNREALAVDEYECRFPDDIELVRRTFQQVVAADDPAKEQTIIWPQRDTGETGLADRSTEASQSDVKAGADAARESIRKIGDYELLEKIGAGGMGVVYLATRADTPFRYAIKMLLVGRNATIEDLARFRIEAEAYACLNHRCIIKIRDVGVVSGCPYLAMDYAENGSLDEFIKKTPTLDIEWRVRTIRQVAEALSHAHGRRIFHRDLKPANILISADGTPKLTDFGLVKFSAPVSAVSQSCCTVAVSVLE
jgi:hypothetical protein